MADEVVAAQVSQGLPARSASLGARITPQDLHRRFRHKGTRTVRTRVFIYNVADHKGDA